MNSFSGPEFLKASRILRALRRGNLLEVPMPSRGEVLGVFEDPAHLLYSLQHFHPHSVGLFIVDPPRANAREAARLWDVDEEGHFRIREVASDDPDYRYHFASTVLAAVRLMVAGMNPEGWIVAFATPDTYMMVRGALEQYLGFSRFRGELVYQTKSGGSNDSKYVVTEHETVLAFSMSDAPKSLRISKNEDQLARYDLQDERGRFTWDTFPRKNARNYYPIECPDGSRLEIDADGNRISWLWSESTFKKAYAEGDVEIRNVDGAWKVYYKDRLKNRKVVRSLTLHGSPLGEILGTLDEDAGTGRQLQTATGTQEIQGFVGVKPDYAKPSRLFSFLIEAFDQDSGQTVIPFADRGSAALSGYLTRLSEGIEMSGLLANNPDEGQELWEWRLQQAPEDVRSAARTEGRLPSLSLESLALAQLDLEQIAALVSLESERGEVWNELDCGHVEGLWRNIGEEVQVVLSGPPPEMSSEDFLCVQQLHASGDGTVKIWGTTNAELVLPNMREQGLNAEYRQVPGCFLP